MKRTLLTIRTTKKSQGRPNTTILHATTMTLIAITLLIPTASAGIVSGIIDTVDGTIAGIQEQTIPRVHVETQDAPTGSPQSGTEAAEADEGITTSGGTPGALHTIETVAWWPVALAMAILVLAVAITLVRRREKTPRPRAAKMEEAEVVWSSTQKSARQETPRSDAMAALERDLAGPASKAGGAAQ